MEFSNSPLMQVTFNFADGTTVTLTGEALTRWRTHWENATAVYDTFLRMTEEQENVEPVGGDDADQPLTLKEAIERRG